MAEVSAATNLEPVSCKLVQELVENGENQVPDGYIWKDSSNYGSIDPCVPLAKEIPVIDFSKLIGSSPEAMDTELKKLRFALTSWGCFQTTNHGMDNSFLDEVRDVFRQFFHMPMKEKQKYARSEGGEGYGNDMVLFENQQLDWVDRLFLLVAPQDQRKLQYWPEYPESFRNIIHEYVASIVRIQEQLLKSIAQSISLPEDCFLNQFGERAIIQARFNYYPPCSRHDQVLGLKPHADGSGITVLLQDREVEGLQLQKDNQWFRVPILPHAILVNAGYQLEIMSNGMFKSPLHKAITNSERERISLALFCSPDPENEIEPLEELLDDERPKLYKKVRNYREIHVHYFQQGKRSIDAFKI